MGKALIYTRVSFDQAGGRSPAEQEAESRAWCEREGHEVVDVITDSVGASRHSRGKRTGWEQVPTRLASGDIDLLVTWEASRAQRDLADYAALRDLCAAHGVLWAYSGRVHDLSTPDGRFRTGLDALLAEREADEISERVQRALRANAASGKPHGSPRLFGYRRTYDPDTGESGWEPDPDEADVVRDIFRAWLSGRGSYSIADELEARGIVGTRGRRFTPQSVRRLVRNPAYVALRVHKGEVIGPASWPPLIDQDTWDRAQARDEETRWRQQRRQAHLLAGIARCGICGQKMAVRRFTRRNGTRHLTYQCDEHYVARGKDRLEAWVTSVVLGRLRQPQARRQVDSGPAPEVEAARARAAELRRERDEAMALWRAGKLSVAAYAEMEQDLTARLAAAERESRRATVSVDLPGHADDVGAWWDSKSVEQQREIIASLLVAVLVHPVGRGRRNYNTGDVTTVEWRQP